MAPPQVLPLLRSAAGGDARRRRGVSARRRARRQRAASAASPPEHVCPPRTGRPSTRSSWALRPRYTRFISRSVSVRLAARFSQMGCGDKGGKRGWGGRSLLLAGCKSRAGNLTPQPRAPGAPSPQRALPVSRMALRYASSLHQLAAYAIGRSPAPPPALLSTTCRCTSVGPMRAHSAGTPGSGPEAPQSARLTVSSARTATSTGLPVAGVRGGLDSAARANRGPAKGGRSGAVPERIWRWRVRDPSLRISSCSCIRGGSGPKFTGSDEQSACGGASGQERG